MGWPSSTRAGEDECTQSLRGKDRTKDAIEKTRHRWKDDIKMDSIETGLGGMD
jgi:hypothetical protein